MQDGEEEGRKEGAMKKEAVRAKFLAIQNWSWGVILSASGFSNAKKPSNVLGNKKMQKPL